jgi:CBS domain-containing protein
MPVKEIMRYGVTTVSPGESVNRVMNLMTHRRVRHVDASGATERANFLLR